MRQRSAIEWQDIVAATFVVGEDLIECDYLTIDEAISNLPVGGGKITCLTSTYKITSTITLPADKDIVLEFVGGATIDPGTNAIFVFTIPAGLTGIRHHRIYNLTVVGGDVAGQGLLQTFDAGSKATIHFYDPNVTLLRNCFDHQAGDPLIDFACLIFVWGGDLIPPGTGTGYLVKTNNTAGTFAYGSALYLNETRTLDLFNLSYGWKVDYDGDMWLYGTDLHISGANKINGLIPQGSQWIIGATNADTDSLETFGRSWDAEGPAYGFNIWRLTLKLSNTDVTASPPRYRGVWMSNKSKIIVNCKRAELNVTQYVDVFGAPSGPAIDILAGANDCHIEGGFLEAGTTALIRTAALRTRIAEVNFSAASGINTILETGAADYTVVGEDNVGLQTGLGLGVTAANSVVIGEEVVQARAQWDSITAISIRPYKGRTVSINGEKVQIPSGGNAVATTSTLIDASGVPVLTTNSTEVTAGGDFNNTTDPLTVIGAVVTYPAITFVSGKYIKIGTEILKVTLVAGNDVTFARGQFGTTIAVHANGVTIFVETSTVVTTLYYLYQLSSGASFSPSSLRLSTTAPTAVRGALYLGSSGNALNCRFIGFAYTISNAGTPNFADNLKQRLVINYYNRRLLKMFSCPNYVNNNAGTNYNVTDTVTWVSINGGTDDHLDYVANGEDAAEFAVHGYVDVGNTSDLFRMTVGEDVVTAPYDDSSGGQGYTSTENLSQGVIAKAIFNPAAAGLKSALHLFTGTTTAGFTVIHADEGRYGGASADIPVTYIDGWVWG